MTAQQRGRAALVAALALIATGCSTSPQPTPTPAPASSPSRLPSTAPRVQKSWDASSYRDKPCALFTDDQARVLGYLEPGSIFTGEPDAATCMRDSGSGPNGDFVVKYYYATDLLGKIYRREILYPGVNSASPTTIAGQPALKPTMSDAAICTVAVALADTQGFEVRIADKTGQPCDQAVHVAETIMHNLGA
jgi:hypothetical protein